MNKLLLLVLAVILFVGCTKNNAPVPQSSVSVVGKWYFTTDTLNEYTNGTLQHSVPKSYNRTDYTQFNSDGTGEENDSSIVTNFTYTVSGKTITLNYPAQTIDGSSYPQSSETTTIRSVTANNLVLFFDDSFTNGDGSTGRDTEAEYFSK